MAPTRCRKRRFALQFGLGYVDPEEEVAIMVAQEQRHPIEDLGACASLDDVLALRRATREVRVSGEVRRYAVDLARATRMAPGVQLGASPRASLALMAAAQALALLDGQAFVAPEHVQEMAGPVLAHRLAIEPQARFAGRTADALVAYDETRTVLAETLGADPGPELRALYAELLRQSEAPTPPRTPITAAITCGFSLAASLTLGPEMVSWAWAKLSRSWSAVNGLSK